LVAGKLKANRNITESKKKKHMGIEEILRCTGSLGIPADIRETGVLKVSDHLVLYSLPAIVGAAKKKKMEKGPLELTSTWTSTQKG